MDNTTLFYFIFNLSHQSSILDSLMVFGADYLIFFTFLLMGILTLKGGVKEKKSMVVAILGIMIALMIEKIIHIFFYHPRPFVTLEIIPLIKHTSTSSFPSGHTTVMAAIAFAYYFYKSKYWKIFLFLMLWVGIARIYVGVHYPLDILGGIMTGFVAIFLAWQFKKYLIKKLMS